MATTRPRRNLPTTSYKGMLNSDSEDSELSSFEFDSSEAFPTSSTQEHSNSTEVVRLPTRTEVLETQEFIRTKAAELVIVNAEYKEAKRRFEAVQERRNAMEQELLERKAYLAPVRTLPQEVLGLIFLFYTNDLAQSPWVLMQVTRTWRATALSTRAIWAKIMLTSPAWKASGASRRKEGREVCGNKEQLDRALRRAGNEALDIMFALDNPRKSRWTRKYDRQAIRGMLWLLASSRKCLQVRHLEINGPHGPSMYDHWPTPGQLPTSLEFPELRTVCIKSPLRADLIANILSASERVTEAEFLVPLGIPYLPFGIENLVQYPAMAALTLDARQLSTDRLSIEKIRSILDNTPYLATLQLSSFWADTSNLPLPILRLPSVHTLSLSTGSKIWPLDASNLTSLVLSGNSFIHAGLAGSNHFPLLTSLTVDAPSASGGPPDYLKTLHFPPLHTLDLCFGTNLYDLVELLSHQANLCPVVFKLRKTVLSTACLTKIIDSMDRLEELHLDEVPLKKDFFDFLASNLDGSGDIELHCSLLVRLRVDLKTALPTQQKTLKPAATNAINARVKAGIAMEMCSLRLSENKGWLDLLP